MLLLFISCAPAKPIQPPKVTFENPTKFIEQPSDPAFAEAYSAYQQGNQQKAREGFAKILRKNPDNSVAYLGMAYSYFAENDLDAAAANASKALQLNEQYPQAHFVMSAIYEARQDYDSAIKELDAVSQLNPEYPGVQQSRNILRIKATEMHMNEAHRAADTNPAEALRQLKLAEQLAPEVAETKIEIANLLLKQNNCEDAVPYLQAVVNDNPNLQLPLADCLASIDRPQEALAIYQQLSSMHPEDKNLQEKIKATQKRLVISKLPDEYQQIPTTSNLSRAQLAAVIAINLNVLEKYNPQSTQIVVDILNHWAQPYIQKMVELQIMDLYLNRTFQPDQPVTKVELAKAASRILEILATEGKTIPSSEQATDIPDVPISNIYYPMIAKVLSAGVLTLDADGRFHPSRDVSGAEALSMINHLKSLAE